MIMVVLVQAMGEVAGVEVVVEVGRGGLRFY
jgi:hypothetical protein